MYRAAALGTLVFALVACSSSATTSEPSFIASPTSSAADFASPSIPPLTSAQEITWSEVPFDGYIADIIGDGDRFVAVGAGGSGASAWSSPDGSTWEQHDVPEQSFFELPDGSAARAGMGTLVRLGDTLYSFGATARFNDASHGAGWRWSDGQAWEAIQSASEFFAGEVIAVTASDEALLASAIAFGGGPRGTPSIWRWTPATSWVRTSLPSDIIVGALTWAHGTFLAAELALAAGGAQPSMWISADGSEWTNVEPPDGASDVCALTSMAADGFLAFGRASDRIAAWTSTDGAAWVESGVELADVSGIIDESSLPGACRVVAVDGGLVAVVLVGDGTLVWTSRDGVSWEFKERLELSGGSSAPIGYRVPLAALGRHVLLAASRSDPAAPGGSRQVLFVGVVDP